MKEILKFEIFYKLLMNSIVLPCLSILTGWFLRYVIGDTILYNFDMVYALFSIPGILFVIAYIIVIMICIFFEYIVIYKLVYCFKHKQHIDWKNLSLSSIQDLKLLRSKAFPFLCIYFILLNPLWHLSFVSSFLPRISIPSFIINEALKMQFGSYLVLIGYVLLFILYALLSYVPFYMIYQKDSFFKACKKSIHKMLHTPKLWILLFGIFIVYYVLETYMFPELLLTSSDFNFYFLRYFIFSSYFRFRTLLFIAYSIIWTLVEVFFISNQLQQEAIHPICLFEVSENKYKISIQKKLFRHKMLYSALFLCGILVFIIMYFHQWPLVHPPYSIGHRGDISQVENSLEGILAADENHADFAEIDIQMTKDNILVVCHDTNLKRLTGKDLEIKDCTLHQLQELTLCDRYGHKAKIPTLEQAIQTAKNSKNQIGLLIEFKPLEGDQEETVEQTIQLIEKYDFYDKAMFMSMDKESVQLLASKRPDWWIGYCAFGNLGHINIRLNDSFIPDFIAVEESMINTQLLEDARNNDLPVYVWTVDDIETINDYLNMGISGIIGDASDQVSYAVNQFKENHVTKNEYLTTCPGFPALTEDESEYVQCNP